MPPAQRDYTAVVIGSGFGGTFTALPLARAFKARGRGETLLMLERGTWWTTPVGTVQDKEVRAASFLEERGQPVQFWPAVEHFKGFIDIALRCARRKGNEDGLYDLTTFGRTGLFGLGAKNDGVTILRASGVGGGSLVYANVTIRPPDFVVADPQWPIGWSDAERDRYFDLARSAIGYGVLWALDDDAARRSGAAAADPRLKVNTGLSNIVTRSARLDPHWNTIPTPGNPRGVRRLAPGNAPDPKNALWIDRARVFQQAMSQLTNDYGTVDSSINDLPPEPAPYDPGGSPKNYCERQGRCVVGCLPGARHTLNKQLMAALYGKPADQQPQPLFPDMRLEALAEVEYIEALHPGYAVHYLHRDPERPRQTTRRSVTANIVILAAGCVGTNEILLGSNRPDRLPGLSPRVGHGFSTNGDYLAFLEGTDERVSLTRGPITTSFAHFNVPGAGPGGENPAKFHTIEDNGVPRAFASLLGFGLPVVRALTKGHPSRFFILVALLRWALRRLSRQIVAFLTNARQRQPEFWSEDEYTANMMCIAAMGREQAKGVFRLGRTPFETRLRLKRSDGIAFFQDPIYQDIRETLGRFAERLVTKHKPPKFLNPFLTEAADALKARAIGLSHPLGGCRMAASPDDGVVDEFGRVFDTRPAGPFHPGLYVADGSIVPTALGVNPSLTISALALRIAERLIERDLQP